MRVLSRRLSLVLAAVLGVSLLGPAAPAAADRDLIGRKGSLTTRLVATPSGAANQQIAAASIDHRQADWELAASVTLRGTPSAATPAELIVEMGYVKGSTCYGDRAFATRTDELDSMFRGSGNVITLLVEGAVARAGDWDCATVRTVPIGGGTPYDGLGGGLTSIYGTPKLAITGIEVLRKKQQRLTLVRGVWTTVEVTVANSAAYGAPDVRLSGAGKGMAVKTAKLGEINSNGGKTTARLKVRLKGKQKKTRLRLTATSPRGGTVTRTIRVKRIKAAKRPANGRYRAKTKGTNAKVSFRVKKGRVVGFRVKGARMTCRAPGSVSATYHTINLTYPKKVKVPRSGIVDAAHEWRKGNAWYNAWLRMKVGGKKIKQGNYTYVTANWCRTSVDFTARRVGR